MARAWLLLVAFWMTAGTARADVFVVPPPVYEGDVTDGAKVGAALVEVIKGELGEGGSVIPPEKAVEFLPTEQRKWCASGECMERYRSAANATAAVGVRVYRLGEGAGPATSFQLAIQPSPGLEYSEGVVLDRSSSLGEQARAAVREVLRKYRRGPGPHLSITGAPQGAVVFVDGEPKGRLPAFLTVTTGAHRIRVEATGFAPQTRFVALQSATSFEEMSFRLEPESRSAEQLSAGNQAAEQDRDVRLTRKQRVGVGLMTAGSATLVTGAVYAITSALQGDGGECIQQEGPYCVQRSESRDSGARVAAGAAVTAVGAASLLAGAIIFKREKNRLSLSISAQRDSALVSVRRTF